MPVSNFAKDKPFKIEPKRDFGRMGFLINGKWVNHGYVVTRGGANIMPGATWFRTWEDANRAIFTFEQTNSSDEFWSAWRKRAA